MVHHAYAHDENVVHVLLYESNNSEKSVVANELSLMKGGINGNMFEKNSITYFI